MHVDHWLCLKISYKCRPALQADSSKEAYYPLLKVENMVDAVGIFADSLCHPDKGIRLPTLRILCHYEPLNCETSARDQPAEKKMKTEVSQADIVDSDESNVRALCSAAFILCHRHLLDN